jgi:hypothetical protein
MARQLLIRRQSELRSKIGSHGRLPVALSRSYRKLERRLVSVEWSQHSDLFVSNVGANVGCTRSPVVQTLNETKVASRTILSTNGYQSLKQLTALDSELLSRMMANGLLGRRSPKDLDDEFAETASRMNIVVHCD